MSSTQSSTGRLPHELRHPAEFPFFIFMVILNIVIFAVMLDLAIALPFLPEQLRGTGWALAIRIMLFALLSLVPVLIVIRETQRASVRGSAVELSDSQFPELYQTAENFAATLGLRRRPDIFLANGNGALNAFAAQATGHDYVVLSNELFVNLYNSNRDGLRFILGHEMGHIRLHHVSLWYQIAVAYPQRLPLLGPALSRLREYSCDRHGAYLSPHGATGLVLLASGRYTEIHVNVAELLRQGRKLRGFWVGLAHLPRSHPFTVRRLERLYRLGLFKADNQNVARQVLSPAASRPVDMRGRPVPRPVPMTEPSRTSVDPVSGQSWEASGHPGRHRRAG
jgi:Zn-dependent protease with chaperone function